MSTVSENPVFHHCAGHVWPGHCRADTQAERVHEREGRCAAAVVGVRHPAAGSLGCGHGGTGARVGGTDGAAHCGHVSALSGGIRVLCRQDSRALAQRQGGLRWPLAQLVASDHRRRLLPLAQHRHRLCRVPSEQRMHCTCACLRLPVCVSAEVRVCGSVPRLLWSSVYSLDAIKDVTNI